MARAKCRKNEEMKMAREVIMLPLCAMLFSVASVALSSAAPAPKTMGDWLIFADAQKPDRYSSDERIHAAVTDALDGREGRMGIWGCGRYSVAFNFEPDVPFDGKKPEEMGEGKARVAYSKVLPSETELSPMVLERGDVEHFVFDADILARSAKFMMCPTQEAGSRCLTFSLKGFTAALKAICPKR
jgi:hypothetical protein